MFKITKSHLSDRYATDSGNAAGYDFDLLTRFCRVESWTADLSTGLFKIGPLAHEKHGLATGSECGLLTLVRCYRKDDRYHVLEILESASGSPSRFCISTETSKDNGDSTSLICIGESQDFDETGAGMINGVFLFPRLATATNDSVIPMFRQ